MLAWRWACRTTQTDSSLTGILRVRGSAWPRLTVAAAANAQGRWQRERREDDGGEREAAGLEAASHPWSITAALACTAYRRQ